MYIPNFVKEPHVKVCMHIWSPFVELNISEILYIQLLTTVNIYFRNATSILSTFEVICVKSTQLSSLHFTQEIATFPANINYSLFWLRMQLYPIINSYNINSMTLSKIICFVYQNWKDLSMSSTNYNILALYNVAYRQFDIHQSQLFDHANSKYCINIFLMPYLIWNVF